MRKHILYFCGITLLYGCQSIPEAVIMPVDTTWQVSHIQGYSTGPDVPAFVAFMLPPIIVPSLLMDLPASNTPGLVEYIHKDQKPENWTEKLTIQYLGAVEQTPHSIMKQAQTLMIKRCPNVFWRIIGEDAQNVLYEWRTNECPDQVNHHEIARLMQGFDGIHRIAYMGKVKELSVEKRDRWIRIFTEAYVDKDDKKVN